MPAIQLLSLALGLAFLSGINLYLTTFLAGLAVRIGWLPELAGMPGVEFLAHPAVMIIAFLLFLLEAVVDKIPWVDSLWDALHTVIRPAGAVLLALQIVPGTDYSWQIPAGIAAAVIGLTTHLTKAGARLLINASPEPVSNIIASLVEDLLVVGLIVLVVKFPVTGLATCLSLLFILWILLPRVFRLVKASLYLMWKKLRLPGRVPVPADAPLPDRISADQDILLAGKFEGNAGPPAWAVPCVTGKARGFARLRPNTFGLLVSLRDQPGTLVFLTRKRFRQEAVCLTLPGCEIRHDSAFLSENLIVYSRQDKQMATFRFTRAHGKHVARLVVDLQRRLGQIAPAQSVPPALSGGSLPSMPTASPAVVSRGMALVVPEMLVRETLPPLPDAPGPDEARVERPISPFPGTETPARESGDGSPPPLEPIPDAGPFPSFAAALEAAEDSGETPPPLPETPPQLPS